MATITLSLTDAEQNAFQQLLDLALRNNGVGALSVVSHFFSLINQAAQQTGAAQVQVNTSAAPVASAASAAQDPHTAAQSSTKPAAQSVTHPAASQPQQPAPHSSGILGTIESALGLGHANHPQANPASAALQAAHTPPAAAPAAQPATAPAAAVTSAPAATPAAATATATPAAQTTGNTPAVS